MKLAAGALVLAASAGAQATPYLDHASWLAAANPGSRQVVFPDHNMIFQDGFGSFTYEQRNDSVIVGVSNRRNDPTATSWARNRVPDFSMSAGKLQGHFTCYHAEGPVCVGSVAITYILPRKIRGFSGELEYHGRYSAEELSFFGLNLQNYEDIRFPDYIYNGFFGKIFDVPTDRFTITWQTGEIDGLPLALDSTAYFTIWDTVALIPGNAGGGSPVRVSEPLSITTLGVGLAALALISRRRRKTGATAV